MTKLLIGIVLMVVGLLSCIGVPALMVAGMDPDEIERQASEMAILPVDDQRPVEVDEGGTYIAWLINDYERDGQRLRIEAAELPDGAWEFVDEGGSGTPIAEQIGQSSVSMNGVDYEMLGQAELVPGTYTFSTPPGTEEYEFAVQRFAIPDFAIGILIGIGVAALLGVVGLILLILGIVDLNRKKRIEQMDDD